MRRKKRRSFYSFAKRFFVASFIVFLFGNIAVKSIESGYVRQEQQLNSEIASTQSDIDSLKIEKQELASFSRVSDVASADGYTYQNSAVATTVDSGDSE